MTNYQTQTQTVAPLIEPTAVIPAQLAPYIPPPQPAYLPAANAAVPGVVVNPDGTVHYGHAPIIYAQPQATIDPQVAAQVAVMNAKARMMGGGGVLLAGAGAFVSGVGLAAAEIGAGGMLGVAALMAVGKLQGAPRRIVNNITSREEYHQHVNNTATGWFVRAAGSVNSQSSHTTTSTISS